MAGHLAILSRHELIYRRRLLRCSGGYKEMSTVLLFSLFDITLIARVSYYYLFFIVVNSNIHQGGK